jgi:cobalamin biosynthesis protein CobT
VPVCPEAGRLFSATQYNEDMTMKTEHFQHELASTTKVFSRKDEVQVMFHGDSAYTSGKAVVLPALPHGVEIEPDDARIMRGFVDHEAGHIRHSNIPLMKDVNKACEAKKNKLLPALMQAMEDVRLERKVLHEYIGSEKNLNATTKAVNSRFLERMSELKKEDEDRYKDIVTDPIKHVAMAITAAGRKDYGGAECQQILDMMPQESRDLCAEVVGEIEKCENTEQIINLALKIEAKLRGEEPPPEEEDRQGEGIERERESGEEAPQECEFDKDKLFADAPGMEVCDDFDVASAVNQTFAQYSSHSTSQYSVFTTVFDKWHTRHDTMDKYGCQAYDDKAHYGRDRSLGAEIIANGKPADYAALLENMTGSINSIRRKLERALLAKQNRDWDYAQAEGRLDTRRLVGAFSAEPDVFKRRMGRPEMDTAVQILVDLSGSMQSNRPGSKSRVAMECIIAIAEAIDKSGCEYEILGFNERTAYYKQPHTAVVFDDFNGKTHREQEAIAQSHTRMQPMDMYVFKGFDEKLNHCKGAISKIADCVGGANADPCAVLYAADRLRARRTQRKILLVLSDGQPAMNTHYADTLRAHLKYVVKQCSKEFDEVIGIGIQSDAVKYYYPKYVVVASLDELAGKAIDMIARSLLGDKFVVNNAVLMKKAS